MAAALIGGMLRSGFLATQIVAVDPLEEARRRLSSTHAIQTGADATSLVPGSDLIVLAVKPQHLADVARALGPLVGAATVLSIAAGIRIVDIGRWLTTNAAGRVFPLVRAMPNTPALIGMGITGAYAGGEVGARGRALTTQVLEAVGQLVWVQHEQLLDPVTAVSGSGPAYVFYFLEAMQAAGARLGLDPATAGVLALETFRGAAELAARSPEDFATLRTRVTSPGGTTERALQTMMHDAVHEAIGRALDSASARAAEMADQMGRDA